jgi:hypothetical protein
MERQQPIYRIKEVVRENSERQESLRSQRGRHIATLLLYRLRGGNRPGKWDGIGDEQMGGVAN